MHLALTPAAPSPLVGRAELGALVRSAAAHEGLLLCSADGELAAPMGPDGRRHAEVVTGEALDAAGVGPDDRVVVALNNDGAGVGVHWAHAASSIARAACCWGPRQPRRLLRLLREVDAGVLVTTAPLARRLGREARFDGEELAGRIRTLVLVGPVADPDVRDLAATYGCEVREVWCDPIFGIGMAVRDPLGGGPFQRFRPGLVELVPVEPVRPAEPVAEWVLALDWEPWAGVRLGTGLVGPWRPDGALHPPAWTVGDLVLVRGRWLSLPVVAAVVAPFRPAGRGAWSLQIRRGLVGDRAELLVDGFEPSVLPALQRALDTSSPVRIEVVVDRAAGAEPWFVDHRRQHLGP